MRPTRLPHIILVWLVVGVGLHLAAAAATSTLSDELWQGFTSRINLQAFGLVQQPVDSRVNPGNVLNLPRYQAEVDIRPDLRLTFRRLEVSIKPRLELRWQQWEEGSRQGDRDTEVETFVHEWLVRYRMSEQLFASYGRENLQWGPAHLLSLSNPFNAANGQNNPRIEVPGLDYSRVVWIPSREWTVSVIANTDEGRFAQRQDFHRTYAVKLDYNAQRTYVSLIPAYREDGVFRLGFFTGWTVSDALLLHMEGSIPEHIDDTAILVGGSYTFTLGPTIVIEFLHDGSGCRREPIGRCVAPGTGIVAPTSGLIRQHYVLVQYTHTHLQDRLNLTLRWMHNLDDTVNRLIGIIDYELGDHIQLFVIGNVNTGGKQVEFGSLVDYAVMAGVSYTF